jgi:hypothetical protein
VEGVAVSATEQGHGQGLTPEEDLAEVERQIAELTDKLKPLYKERARLRGILAGPRVRPVLADAMREDEECEDLDDAFAKQMGALDSGWPMADKVLVGGAEVTYDEWAEANPEKAARWW